MKGVSSQTVDVVEVFLENSKKGGGPIKEFAFNDAEGEVSVIFEDELGRLTVYKKVGLHCTQF